MRWKWSNVPIPEFHVALLITGIILDLFAPWRFFTKSWINHATGWPPIFAGILTVVWAVKSIKDIDISKPTKVISTGPYRFSRHPMYVAWTLIYLGITLVINSIWLIVFLPVVLVVTHYRSVIREERYLEQKFGGDYHQYKARVRRYL